MTDQTSEVLQRVDVLLTYEKEQPVIGAGIWVNRRELRELLEHLRTALKDTERLDKAQATRYDLIDPGIDGQILTGYAWGIHGQCEDIRTAIDAMSPTTGTKE